MTLRGETEQELFHNAKRTTYVSKEHGMTGEQEFEIRKRRNICELTKRRIKKILIFFVFT